MQNIKKYIAFLALVLPLLSLSQNVENIHFEQVGKQIHIYYDLEGDQEYTVQVFCSTDDGKTWGEPLQKVTGAVGENQIPGSNKKIVWDVLAEKDELSGEIFFKVIAQNGNSGTFTDSRDDQKYKWVKIGNKIWMAENLNYKTNNGSSCYDNKEKNCRIYGRLYNWNTAKMICPDSWHLPTDAEWKTLEMFLGMSQSEAHQEVWRGTDEGEKLKSISYWKSNGNGTDALGFSALPGGYRGTSGNFRYLGSYGYWWSASECSSADAWVRYLSYHDARVDRVSYNKEVGFSIRCVKN